MSRSTYSGASPEVPRARALPPELAEAETLVLRVPYRFKRTVERVAREQRCSVEDLLIWSCQMTLGRPVLK